MNPVASLLTIDGIALNVDAPSRKRAFEELAHLFEKNAGIPYGLLFIIVFCFLIFAFL